MGSEDKRFLAILIVVVALAITVPSIVYYELSYNSVNGTHPEIVTGYRSASYFSATFYVTVHVWSWAGSLDTQVTSPAFTLTVNNFPFGTQVVTSGTFQPKQLCFIHSYLHNKRWWDSSKHSSLYFRLPGSSNVSRR